MIFHPLFGQRKLVPSIPSVRALISFRTTSNRFWFSQTLPTSVQHGMELSKQVVLFRGYVHYGVLLLLCDQGVYPTSIEVWIKRRGTPGGMWSVFLNGEPLASSPALDARSPGFGLRCGVTFVIFWL